jgi:PleD family two-component response regulator
MHSFASRRNGKDFAISKLLSQALTMTKPLALFFHQNLLLGNQLVNRLQDLGYRVQVITDVNTLVSEAEKEKPLLVVTDLIGGHSEYCERMIKQLRANPETAHIPVLAVASDGNDAVVASARTAGATLVAAEKALLPQLPQLLEQVLELD